MTSLTPSELSDAVHLLSTEGTTAVFNAFPSLRGHKGLVRDLYLHMEDHADLEHLTARAAARIEECESSLRRAVLGEAK